MTRKKPMRLDRPVLAAALTALLAAAPPAAAAAGSDPEAPETASRGVKSSVVIIIRHAEKSTDDPRNPSLAKEGMERAEALATLLAGAGVTDLFASEFRRTSQTLAPLAARLGLEVREVPAGDPGAQVAALRRLPAGSVAVVSGHSDTVPDLVRLLGGEVSGLVDSGHGPMIDDASHDRMFVVILPSAGDGAQPGPAQVLELRYGE
jgi:phosphohistidine phosphatase SixA